MLFSLKILMARQYYPSYKKEESNELVREISAGRVLAIPTLHYQAGDSSLGVLDEIGCVLTNVGLENNARLSGTRDRWYGAMDPTVAIMGSPIVTVNAHENSTPDYLRIRKDGTNETIKLHGKAVSVDLRVENAFDNPSFVMVSGLPLYEKVKSGLFELSQKIPFIDNEEYREYINRFSNIDSWLKLKRDGRF
jgi:hypothetical protein